MSKELIQKADFLIERKRFKEAADLIRQVLSNNPNEPMALSLMAICQEDLESPQKAIEIAKRAIEVDANVAFSWQVLCGLLLRNNAWRRRSEIEQIFETWGRLSERALLWIQRYITYLLMKREIVKAKDLLKEGLSRFPNDPPLLAVKGCFLVDENNMQGAREMLELVGELDPNSKEFWLLKYRIEYKLNDLEAAQKSYEEVLKIDPTDEDHIEDYKKILHIRHPFSKFLFLSKLNGIVILPIVGLALVAFIVSIFLSEKNTYFLPILASSLIILRWFFMRGSKAFNTWVLSFHSNTNAFTDISTRIIGKYMVAAYFLWVIGMLSSLWWQEYALPIIFGVTFFFELVVNNGFYFSFLPEKVNDRKRLMFLGIQAIIVGCGIYYHMWSLLVGYYVFLILTNSNGKAEQQKVKLEKPASIKREQLTAQQTFEEEYADYSIEELLEEGRSLIQEGNLEKAKLVYFHILELDPSNISAKKGLVRIIRDSKDDLIYALFFPIWENSQLNSAKPIVFFAIIGFYISIPLLAVYFFMSWYFSVLLGAMVKNNPLYKPFIPLHKKRQIRFFGFWHLVFVCYWFMGNWFLSVEVFNGVLWMLIGSLFFGIAYFESVSEKGREGTLVMGLIIIGFCIFELFYGLTVWRSMLFLGVLYCIAFSLQAIGGLRKEFELKVESIK